MKTYVAPGETMTLTAPATASAGVMVKVGEIIGVHMNDVASAAPAVVQTKGIMTVAHAVTNTAATVGAFAYYDTTNNAISNTSTTGFIKVGVYAAAKATTEAVATVRFNGAF